MANTFSSHLDKQALYMALGCYLAWGIFPLYWKLLGHLAALETLAHRFIWSFAFYLAIFVFMRGRKQLVLLPPSFKEWMLSTLASLLLAVNWGIFIYAINTGRILEGSLAYFINPLLSVAVGVFFFHEPFPKLMKFAFVMALLGVCIKATFGQQFPWIALILATTFCAYGVVKKTVRIGATQFSLMESGIGLLPALALAFWTRAESGIMLSQSDWMLLIGAGIVTGLPLFLFAIAAQKLPYSLMGMLQFIGPSLQFIVGLVIYEEKLTSAGMISFLFIWIGVGCYLADKLHSLHRQKQKQSDEAINYIE